MPKKSRNSSLYTLEEAAFAHWTGHALPRGSGPHLFLAEDEPVLRSLMHMNLALAGYRVTPFSDGADLLHALERSVGTTHEPDLVISEVRMPGVLGLKILEVVRLGPAWRIPFLLISGFEDRDLHDQAFRLGAQVVLEKPFEIRTLLHEARVLAEPVDAVLCDVRY